MCGGRHSLQALFVSVALLGAMDLAIIIPGSYDITIGLGSNATMSGFLIGVHPVGMALGSLLGKLLLRLDNHAQIRCTIIASLLFLALLSLCFAALLDCSWAGSSSLLALLLCLRTSSGVLIGAINVLMNVMALRVTPLTEVASLSIMIQAARNMGLCLGPLAGSLLLAALHGRAVGSPPLERGGLPVLTTAAFWALAALTFSVKAPSEIAPLVEETLVANKRVGTGKRPGSEISPQQLASGHRKVLVVLGSIFCFERGFSVASIEVATTLILELQFGRSSEAIGFALGVICAVTVFHGLLSLSLLHSGWVGEVQYLKGLGAVGTCSVVFLFNWRASSPLLIIMADCMLYACMFTSNGITDAIASQASLPNTAYSMENFAVAKTWATPLARAVAAPLARFVVAGFGRNSYAGCQLLVAGISLVTTCKMAAVLRQAEEAPESQCGSEQAGGADSAPQTQNGPVIM